MLLELHKRMNQFFKNKSQAGSFLVSLLALGALLTASVAIAAIISGSFATNKSNDVTITQLTISKPTSVAVGDLLLANIAINGGNAAVVTPPTGWTQILRTDNDTNISIISYWKIAGVSEASSYTWIIDHQTTAEGGIIQYSGVDITNPIDASTGNVGFGIVATTSAITTSSPNEEVVTLFAADVGKATNAGAYFTSPVGMTEKYDVSNTPFGPSIATNDAIQVAAGNAGSKSSTVAGNKNRNWVAQQIALRPAPDSTLPNGLISYWKLDESGAADASDSSGNGFTLTNNGFAAYVASKINNGWNGGSANTTKVLATNSTLGINYTTPFTYNSWINVTSPPANNSAATLIQWSDNTTPNNHGYTDVQLYNNAGTMQVYIGRNNVTVNEQYGVDYTFTPGNWYMLTYTWDGSNVKLYINGSGTATLSGPSTSTGTSDFMGLGTHFSIGADTFTARYFSGLMDEVGVWNRVLTSTEVTELFNTGRGLQYPF